MNRNRNSARFFSYAGNGKYFKELFAFNLNKIVASGCWYVYFAPVVQHAGLTNWLQCMQKIRQ